MTNICKDLEILAHDPSFSKERSATIFRDSYAVIESECSKILAQMKSFETAVEPAIHMITLPLVSFMKGFVAKTKTIMNAAERQLVFTVNTGTPSISSKTDLLKAMKESHSAQKDIELVVLEICRGMRHEVLPMTFKEERARLLDISAKQKQLAKKIAESGIFSAFFSESKFEQDYYKDRFLNSIPETIYALTRLTFMFEAQNPKKIKDKLADLPRQHMENAIQSYILAELKRDADFFTSERFVCLKETDLYRILENDFSGLIKSYHRNSELIQDLAHLYLNIAQTADLKAREQLINGFSNHWNSAELGSKYSDEIDATVIRWLLDQNKPPAKKK